tara:strand:- start:367 stop:741 length:375 start_codon:yes stop_codon:yes gene_type:complete
MNVSLIVLEVQSLPLAHNPVQVALIVVLAAQDPAAAQLAHLVLLVLLFPEVRLAHLVVRQVVLVVIQVVVLLVLLSLEVRLALLAVSQALQVALIQAALSQAVLIQAALLVRYQVALRTVAPVL